MAKFRKTSHFLAKMMDVILKWDDLTETWFKGHIMSKICLCLRVLFNRGQNSQFTGSSVEITEKWPKWPNYAEIGLKLFFCWVDNIIWALITQFEVIFHGIRCIFEINFGTEISHRNTSKSSLFIQYDHKSTFLNKIIFFRKQKVLW